MDQRFFSLLLMTLQFLIHDRDAKFTEKFQGFWSDDGIRYIIIPPKSPKVNAFVDAFSAPKRKNA